jgi:hypothetical protein
MAGTVELTRCARLILYALQVECRGGTVPISDMLRVETEDQSDLHENVPVFPRHIETSLPVGRTKSSVS